nr:ATP-dependent Clp protease proteolytic subunit 6, chloroplastic isoform X2 [Setaria viridis]
MAPMATISAPLAARSAPFGLLSHRQNGARARLALRGLQFASRGVASLQDERKRCHSSLRLNTIVASENENPPLMPAIMTPAGPLDLATVLLGNRVIFIGQYINSQVAQRVISQLVTLAAVDEEADILIYLNCPGGSLYSILAIYDCMSWIKPKVGTVAFGVVASQAAIILAGGEKGMRYAMPNTRVMIHQPQGGSEGNVEEVRRQVGETIYARDFSYVLHAES